MSLQVKVSFISIQKLRLAGVFLSALVFYACQREESNISSNTLTRDDELRVVFSDSFLIKSSTFYRDSINTTNPSNYLVGEFSNEAFGKVKCSSFFQAILRDDPFIPGDVIYDSMVLFLDPFYFYGSPEGTIRLNISRLKEGFSRDTGYYVFDELEYNKEPLATVDFAFSDIQTRGLRVRLDSLGAEFLRNSKRSDFAAEYLETTEKFVEYFKGFALTTEVSENTVVGFAPEDAFNQSLTGLYFYYRVIFASNPPDTISESYKFPININSIGFNRIESERAASIAQLKDEGILIPSEDAFNASYVHAGTGLLTQLDIRGADDFATLFDNVVINRAELVIPSTNADIEFYNPPATVFMFMSDSTQNIIPYGTEFPGSIGTGIRVGNDFYVDITEYFQDLVVGGVERSSYLLIPSQNGSTVNQLIMNDQSDPEEPIKLLVYYIPLDS